MGRRGGRRAGRPGAARRPPKARPVGPEALRHRGHRTGFADPCARPRPEFRGLRHHGHQRGHLAAATAAESPGRCRKVAPRERCQRAAPPARPVQRSADRSGQPAAEPDRAAQPPDPAAARPAAGRSRGTIPVDPASPVAQRTGRAGRSLDGEAAGRWPRRPVRVRLGRRSQRSGAAGREPRKAAEALGRQRADAAGSQPSGYRDPVTAATRADAGTPPPAAGGRARPRLRPLRRRWAASSTRTSRTHPPSPRRWLSHPAWRYAGRRSSRAPRRVPPLRRAPPVCPGPSGAPGHAGRRSLCLLVRSVGRRQRAALGPRAAQRLRRRVAQSRRRRATYLAHCASSSWFVRWLGSAPRTIRRSTGRRATMSRSAPCELGS
jgi:hypothetical protein